MGLITCLKCGGAISEKAIVCPHCKSYLSQQNSIMCEECGTEYEIKLSTCPNYGCPNLTIEHHFTTIINSAPFARQGISRFS